MTYIERTKHWRDLRSSFRIFALVEGPILTTIRAINGMCEQVEFDMGADERLQLTLGMKIEIK